MKAIVNEKYGPPEVLDYREIEKPVVKKDEVRIKIIAAALNPADWHLLKADPFLIRFMGYGFFKPKHHIIGADIAGIIEETGEDVNEFKVGDEVFGDISTSGFGNL